MNDVKSIFSESFKSYKEHINDSLYWAIMKNIRNESPAKVPSIMADTYNFYTKWDKAREQEEFDWSQMREESIELVHKYNDCDLCRKVLAEIMNIIEQEFKPGRS